MSFGNIILLSYFAECHLLISKSYKFYNKTYTSYNNRVMKI